MRIVHRFRSLSRPRRLLVIFSTLVLIGGGAAFAYWTGTGSGSGSGSSTTAGTVTVNQTGAPTNINPGRAAQTLSGTFTNSSGTSVYVTSLTASIASVTTANGVTPACTASDYTLSNATVSVGQDIAAGASAAGSWTGPTIAFNNKSNANQDACKGQTVTFSYTTS